MARGADDGVNRNAAVGTPGERRTFIVVEAGSKGRDDGSVDKEGDEQGAGACERVKIIALRNHVHGSAP